jgi:hypothetical protein
MDHPVITPILRNTHFNEGIVEGSLQGTLPEMEDSQCAIESNIGIKAFVSPFRCIRAFSRRELSRVVVSWTQGGNVFLSKTICDKFVDCGTNLIFFRVYREY